MVVTFSKLYPLILLPVLHHVETNLAPYLPCIMNETLYKLTTVVVDAPKVLLNCSHHFIVSI